jgi:hypothetical protein
MRWRMSAFGGKADIDQFQNGPIEFGGHRAAGHARPRSASKRRKAPEFFLTLNLLSVDASVSEVLASLGLRDAAASPDVTAY